MKKMWIRKKINLSDHSICGYESKTNKNVRTSTIAIFMGTYDTPEANTHSEYFTGSRRNEAEDIEENWRFDRKKSCPWSNFYYIDYKVIALIKEIVDEIKKAEAESSRLKAKARESGSEITRKALKKADYIRGNIHKERKGIVRIKVDESEKRAQREAKTILKEAQYEASRVEDEARKFLDEAVSMVFERVTNYGC